jgi:hypothetical protein
VKPTPGQTADTLNQIVELADRLRVLEPTLRARAADSALDGFPRQSGPGAGGHGHGDPVGTTVALRLDHPQADHLGHAHRQVLGKLDQARRLLEEAESTGRQALPPPTRQVLDDGCVSCARIKTWSPIHRTRRCRWCADWARNHGGEDPPIDILRRHADGRRITVRFVDSLRRRR